MIGTCRGKVVRRGLSGILLTMAVFGAAAGALSQPSARAADGGASIVYFNDFDDPIREVGPEWSDGSITLAADNSTKFHGEYGNNVTRLTLQGLGKHSALRLTFKLYILKSWDGNTNSPGAGPDYWHLGIGQPGSESSLFGTVTFSNFPAYNQSYPLLHGSGAAFQAQTGATQVGGSPKHLGYNYPTLPPGQADAIYEISRYVPHTADEVVFSFSAGNLQGISDESWGLDDVRVEIVPLDHAPPSCRVGSVGTINGKVYLPVTVADSGSGVAQVQLTSNSSNCKLEWDGPGSPVPIGGTITIDQSVASTVVRAVKLNNALKARVELRVTDASGNSVVCDPVIANLALRKGGRLSRTFRGIPEHEHYVTLQNGSPGLSQAKLWVNGRLVSQGPLADGQVLTLDVAQWMLRGKSNVVHVIASGPAGAKAVLLIGDASLAGGGMSAGGAATERGATLEFSR